MSIAAKKVLVPLTVLLAAGALAVGSGATFSSESSNTISSVTSGSLTQLNSKKDAAIFNLTNLKPGDTLNGSVTITNTGTLPATFSLTEVASTNGFTDSNLKLVIKNTTTSATVFDGTFGGLEDGKKTDLGEVAAKAANTYVFTVTLDKDTPNDDQGKTASATYQWSSVQLAATSTDQ
ncbi:TasA family protein [Knoellia sp. LjRoot47]|uniref:TasA family protein n=1 Tax=Knoellia sp. LjRoot47 TaxID=3342330 RepID=UPI003ED151E8